MNRILSSSLKELPHLAKTVVDSLQAGDWLFLDGDLGSGKTALAKEISILFGVQNYFTSPTFSILNTEKLPTPVRGIHTLLHLDLYRLKSGNELCYIGLENEFNSQNSIALFEWPNVLDSQDWISFFTLTRCAKPNRILNISIEGDNENREYSFKWENF